MRELERLKKDISFKFNDITMILKDKRPEDGATRNVMLFAFLPTVVNDCNNDLVKVWLQFYWKVETYQRCFNLEGFWIRSDIRFLKTNNQGEKMNKENSELVALTKMLEEKDKKIEELQELAIWMSGCGYDFCQHEVWNKARDRFLLQ